MSDEKQGRRALRVVEKRVGDVVESRQALLDDEAERLAILAKAAGAEDVTIGILKAGAAQDSNVIRSLDEAEKHFQDSGAIEPPYNPATLTGLLEHSNALRQNVDAYATNIEGFGHRLEPIIDLKQSDADDRIRQAIILQRKHQAETPGADPTVVGLSPVPTDEEIAARRKVMAQDMDQEKTKFEQFLNFCVYDESFPAFRKHLRLDREVIGNAYFEVLRNKAGEISEFCYVPAFTVRLMPLDKKRTVVQERRKYSEIDYEDNDRNRYFRRYVQVFESRRVFFKEFGDPRCMSAKSGRVYDNLDAFYLEEWTDRTDANVDPPPQATELVHMAIHSPRSAYGVPRWIGVLLAVLGSRQAEEVNYLYFENKSIPPLAVLVSGGKLAKTAAKRIESFIDSNIKGRKNFHRILVLEAEGGGAGAMDSLGLGRVRVQLQPLTDAQQKDGLFLDYDEKNQDKVGMSFRLPRLLRGDIRDFNRATAEAALEFAEQQVFQPERTEFDFFMNRKILPALGIRYWKFTSNGPTIESPAALADILKVLVEADTVTPEEAREVAEIILKRPLKRIESDWVRQPTKLTVAGIPVQPDIPDSEDYGAEDPLGGENPWEQQPSTLMPPVDPNAPPDPNAPEQKDVGGATGTDQSGAPIAGKPPATPDTTIYDLQTSGGLRGAGKQPRRRRRTPMAQAMANGVSMPQQAQALISLRNHMIEVEAAAEAKAFYAQRKRELQKETIKVPPEVFASWFEKIDTTPEEPTDDAPEDEGGAEE
jgi:PBSX family phage portal protein